MAINDNKTALKSVRQRNFLARDFDGFRAVLLDYARQHYPDRIQDFSESSMGGLFLDMAAYVGDNMSFYMDHLYGELNSDTVVETGNIEKTIRAAGVPITGAASAVVTEDFFVEIPVLNDGSLRPDPSLLPTLLADSVVRADNGVEFTLLEDVQFWTTDADGKLVADVAAGDMVNGRRVAGVVVSKILKKSGTCGSGNQNTETFTIGDFVQFRRLTLTQPDITQIISVTDSLGNTYYPVENLTHDVVYKNVLNTSEKDAIVKDSLKVIPAPYRFVVETSLGNRKSTLIFGGGTADNLEDDIVPDPSEFAISLPFAQTFSRIPVNPQQMLQTATLGVAAANTTLTVTYRHGGGLFHNVGPNTIRTLTDLRVSFPDNPSAGQQAQIKNSIEASNVKEAAGGEDPPTTDQLLALLPAVKNSQERIVTKEDLLARVYTMPSNFGRVFRAAVSKNPHNPLASQLFIISRNTNSELVTSSDKLKMNLKRYLNAYRMISDALDVRDAAIINLALTFQVVADPSLNKSLLLQSIISDLQTQFKITNFHINQPIVLSDVVSTIFSKPGIIAVTDVTFTNLVGTVNNKQYSPVAFDVVKNTKNSIIYTPRDVGAIFEIKNPDINIVGRAVSNV